MINFKVKIPNRGANVYHRAETIHVSWFPFAMKDAVARIAPSFIFHALARESMRNPADQHPLAGTDTLDHVKLEDPFIVPEDGAFLTRTPGGISTCQIV